MTPPFIRVRPILLIVTATFLFQPILRGGPGDDNPTGVAGEFNGNVTTGCSYDPYTGNATRSITDIVVPGAVGAYPLAFTRTMNSRYTPELDTLEFGPSGGWRHSFQWTINQMEFHTTSPSLAATWMPILVSVNYPDGRVIHFHPSNTDTMFRGEAGVPARFQQLPGTVSGDVFLLLPDGGKIWFYETVDRSPPDEWTGIYTLTFSYEFKGIIDPYGQITTVSRAEDGSSVTITEPAGRNLRICYDAGRIDRVEERAAPPPFPQDSIPGRTVHYQYTTYNNVAALDSVVYFDNQLWPSATVTAHYTYQSSNAADGSHPPLIHTCDDPMFSGSMNRIAYEFLHTPTAVHGFLESERYYDGAVGVAVSTLEILDPATTRKEIRGDGPSRIFTYAGGLLKSWTDFKNKTSSQQHNQPNAPGFVSAVVDARTNQIDFLRNPLTGNVTKITYPHTSSDDDDDPLTPWQGTVNISFNAGNYPYYVTSVTNENSKITGYTRDTTTQEVLYIDFPDGAREGFRYDSPLRQLTRHQRKNGYYEHLEYDLRGLLIHRSAPTASETAQPGQPQTTLTYYPLNHAWRDRLWTITDLRGKTTTFEYEVSSAGQPLAGRGLVSKIKYHDGKYVSSGYDARGNKVWEENELRQRISYVYDEFNRVTSVTTPLPESRAAHTYYEYQPISNLHVPIAPSHSYTAATVTRVTTPEGIRTVTRYDENFRRIETVQGFGTDQAATTTFGYDDAGNLESVIDPLTRETKTVNDARNRRTKLTSPPIAAAQNVQYITEWRYDPASNVRLVILPDGTTITRHYDPLNRLGINDLRSADGQQSRITEYKYFPSGRVEWIKDPRLQKTKFEYDGRDLMSKMTYPDETVVQGWVYDDNGNIKERPTIGGPKQLFGYDDRNRLRTMRWSNGIDFSDFDYDDAGRLKSAINPNSTITRDYDVGGRLKFDRQVLATTPNTPAVTITPLSIVSRQVHGDAGTFDIDLPLTGAPGIECRTGPAYSLVLTFANSVTVGGASMNSGVGKITSVVANGNVVTVNLNQVSNAQRLTVRVFGLSDGSNVGELIVPIHVLVGDALGHGVVNSEDIQEAEDHKEETTDATNFRSDFNADGVINIDDVKNVTEIGGILTPGPPAPGPQAQVDYACDDDGKITTLSAPAYAYGYLYDGMGRLQWMGPANNTPGYGYTYDANSNVIERANYVNDTAITFIPDELGRITDEIFSSAGNEFSHLRHTYDAMSRLTYTVHDQDSLDSFGYNFAGELTLEQHGLQPDGHGAFEIPQTVPKYSYDPAGNRLAANGATYEAANPLNQYRQTPGGPVGHGSQHEISNYQDVSYSYLGDTRLASASSTSGGIYELGYDALGRTVRRTTNGQSTFMIYSGESPIMEFDGAGNVVGHTVYGLAVDEILARSNNGDPQFFMQDRLGSTVAVTGSKGQLLEQYLYDGFGTPTIMDAHGVEIDATRINNCVLFKGREWVSQFASPTRTGFYENRARAYHPGLGRFMSEDPMGFDAGDANLFRYCGNDPVNSSDPSGLVTKTRPGGKPPAQIRTEHKGTSPSSNTRYTPTGSHIPQNVTATPTNNGLTWNITYHDYVHGTFDAGNFVLVGVGTGAGPMFASTATPFGRAIELGVRALDAVAARAKELGVEIGGTVFADGRMHVDPPGTEGMVAISIRPDALATFHIHQVVGPNPYEFSHPPTGLDTLSLIQQHPNMVHVVGVLDGPPGAFTIFAYSPNNPFFWERPNPGHTPGFPGGD